ncbi:tryptase delta-like [Dasypus novemcinctus]|uniref:tryptase delta-like n=1 Tax=Dasypus novemcinctus TaxID=9361 RepID=UPI0039C9E3CE
MLPLLLLALPLLASGVHAAPAPDQALERGAIMGGQEASKSKWPWQVSQRLHAAFWVHICGARGPLPRERVSPDAFRVQLREQHLYYGDRLLPVSRVLPHPGYYLAQEGADIALLGLRSPVNLSSRVQPLRLPPAAQAFPAGTPCWVTGWGDVSDDEPLPPPYPLRQVKVPVVDNGDCDAQYHSDTSTGDSVRIVRDDMMCAGRAGRDSCPVPPRCPLGSPPPPATQVPAGAEILPRPLSSRWGEALSGGFASVAFFFLAFKKMY